MISKVIHKFNGLGKIDKRKCCICGCTQFKACPGGCYWVTDNLCSQCFNSSDCLGEEKVMIIMDETDRLFPPEDLLKSSDVISKMLEDQIESLKK